MELEVAGNPITTRLEGAPANCYPGLEADLRNLDRRFFPGLIFEFSKKSDGDPLVQQRGAQLVAVDLSDPDLTVAGGAGEEEENRLATLGKQLAQLSGALPAEQIFLDSVTTGKDGKFDFSSGKIELISQEGIPFDNYIAWRIVRSLPPGPVRIELSRIQDGKRVPLAALEWRRRVFQKAGGGLSDAYSPGELTQSLCSPWQHDFRDCACTYWATNHPDIVLAAHPADIAELDDPGPDQDRAEDPVIWLRRDREDPVPPRGTSEGCRPFEMDHYEINHRWRELAFVLEGREQPAPWAATTNVTHASPVPGSLPELLSVLGGVELALALEYLYARYTVRFYDPLGEEQRRAADFIAHELLNVAIGEMMHLRWVNELLFELGKATPADPGPALQVSTLVPFGNSRDDGPGRAPRYEVRLREVTERSIAEAIDEFIAAEAPSGSVEGLYARILSRLQEGWAEDGGLRPGLIGLVRRIIADGVGHYSRFREIQAILRRPGNRDIVKSLKDVTPDSRDFGEAAKLYQSVIENLERAYRMTGTEAMKIVERAGQSMKELDGHATALARQGKAIPLFQVAREVAGTLEEKVTRSVLGPLLSGSR